MEFPKPQNSFVLLCDVQTYFKKVIPTWDKMIESIKLTLSSASALDVPIIVTEQVPRVFGNTEPCLLECCPNNQRVYSKTLFSMITPEVRHEINKLGAHRDTAILVGLEGHICIFQTCVDLLRLGYTVYLPADAIGSQRNEDFQRAINHLDGLGAKVSSAESVVFQWVKDAGHPDFKKVQPAVKVFSKRTKELAKL